MSAPSCFSTTLPPAETASQEANAWLLRHYDELVSRARACFHHMPLESRDEAVAEVMARALAWALSAAQRGRLSRLTAYWIVTYAARQIRSGRRFTGTAAGCIMSDAARIRGHARRIPMTTGDNEHRGEQRRLREALATSLDDTPPENCRRNHDYPAVLELEGASPKARRTLLYLAETHGEGCHQELAAELGVSPGRVTQLKHELAAAFSRHDYTGPLGARPSARRDADAASVNAQPPCS